MADINVTSSPLFPVSQQSTVTYSVDPDKGFPNNTSIIGSGDDDNNNNNGNVTWIFQTPPLGTEDYVTIPMYSLIFVLSVIGNALVITTLIQDKRMRTVTNVFLLNLSISDLLLAMFCMPFTIIPILMKSFIFGKTVCYLVRYLQDIYVSFFTLIILHTEEVGDYVTNTYDLMSKQDGCATGVSVSVSCFTLVAISLERYFAICRPLHSRKWQTRSHSYKCIALCWALAFVVCLPMAINTKYRRLAYGNYMCKEIWQNGDLKMAYDIFVDVILLLLPVLVMSVSYGKVSYTLWSGMKMDKQENETQNGHSNQIYKDGSHRTTSQRSVTFKDRFGRSVVHSELEDLNRTKKVSTTTASGTGTSTKMRFDARGVRQSNIEKSRAAKRRVIKMLFAVVFEFFVFWTPLFVVQTWVSIDYAHALDNIPQLVLTFVFLWSYLSSCCNPITYCFMNRNFRNGFLSVFKCCRTKKATNRCEMPSYYQYSTASRTGVSQLSSYDKVKDDSDEM